ncbi:MAG: PilZ domain-containing protein [Aquabacterium sp.]
MSTPPSPDPHAQATTADDERRACVRLDPPLGRPYAVSFTWLGETLQFSVHNVSLGGIAFRVPLHHEDVFRPGRVLQGVQLELGSGRHLLTDLEVRLCRPMRTRLLGDQLHVGCRFVHLTPAQQTLLAHAMAALERERGGR